MAGNGDRERAFAEFYDTHYVAVRRYAARHFGESDAEDIAQDTMIRALSRFDTIDPGRSARPWLMTVARNIGIDRRRRDRHVPVERGALEDFAGSTADASEQVSMRVDVGETLDRAMRRMSVGDRRVLVLREVCGFGAGDIATFLGTSNDAIRQRMVRARRSLIRHYAELGGTQYPAVVALRDAVVRPARRVTRAITRHVVPLDAPAERTAAAVAAAVLAATAGVQGTVPVTTPAPSTVVASAPAEGLPRVTGPHLAAPGLDAGALAGGVRGSLDRTAAAATTFTEDWEAPGLPGWRVSGSTATRTCTTGATGCSLAVAPDDAVTLARDVSLDLARQTVLTAYLNVPAGTGGADLALRVTFDTGETLRVAVAPSADARVVLTSSASEDRSELALVSPGTWRPVVVTIDRTRRLASIGGVFAVPLDTVRLGTAPARVASLTIDARRGTASATFGVDTMSVSRVPQCMDGADNDGDDAVDLDDPACGNRLFAESPDPACSDGIDNDDDGHTDWPDDPGCYYRDYGSEAPPCDDGIDNDGDGLVDWPDDPKCVSAVDTEVAQCADGIDNDGDGATDFPAEPGCTAAGDDSETACVAATVPAADVVARNHPVGACLDPMHEIDRVALLRERPGERVVGWAGWYEFGTTRVRCVAVGDTDPCAAAGGRLVQRDGWVVRAVAEGPADADPGGSAGLCTASLTVLLWEDNEPVPSREAVLTLC